MGRDKALLEIDGEPLWRRQLATLRRLSPEQLMISGPPRDGEYEAVADEIENAGPLAGVAAALRKCTSPLLVVLAVDLPRDDAALSCKPCSLLCGDGRGVVPRGPRVFRAARGGLSVDLRLPSECRVCAAATFHAKFCARRRSRTN